MSALVTLRGAAAALLQPNINTDIIAPLVRGPGGMQPAGVRSEAELAQRLFGPWCYDAQGAEKPDFALNRPASRRAKFLLAGPNFACGSSRETATTMLKAFGIRCVIAPSFGLIFHDNCFRNHMLPLTMDIETVRALAAPTDGGAELVLDLQACTLTAPDGAAHGFDLPSFRRSMLLQGTDEVAVTLGREAEIQAWQERARRERPWQWLAGG
ncbi:MAG: 3-isopropylmalate dehydratase small subunit [Candidatus Protistobacter heckmanni]|nr:3-isopropylmalate dehydratase small subunit [Candidatus Protistobacter heckmanni]